MKRKFTDNISQSDIDVGKMLKSYIDEHKIFKSVLARKMARADGNILRFQKSRSMSTAILIEFCFAMKHNFFRDIAQQLPPEFTTEVVPDTTKDEKIAALELEITILKAEKEVLIRAMRGIV